MPLDVTAQVRLRISDRVRYGEEVRGGDGTATLFRLAQGAPASTLTAPASAYLPVAAGWSATGSTLNTALGTIQFPVAISANSSFRVDYLWSVFSDDEIGQFLSDGGGVPGAALQAVKSLQFDGLKRARWAAPDGTQYDDTKAQDTLEKLYADIWAELREAPAGGIESWTQQQQYFPSDYSA